MVIYDREEKRTFANVPIIDGIKTLNDIQFKEWLKNTSQHAQSVAARFNLTETQLLDFLIFLLDRKKSYEDEEKIALSKEIKKMFDLVFSLSVY